MDKLEFVGYPRFSSSAIPGHVSSALSFPTQLSLSGTKRRDTIMGVRYRLRPRALSPLFALVVFMQICQTPEPRCQKKGAGGRARGVADRIGDLFPSIFYPLSYALSDI